MTCKHKNVDIRSVKAVTYEPVIGFCLDCNNWVKYKPMWETMSWQEAHLEAVEPSINRIQVSEIPEASKLEKVLKKLDKWLDWKY